MLREVPGERPGLGDLAPAERAKLVDVDDAAARLTFRHPLIRSTIVAMSTHEERRHAHLVLADLLTEDPERQAWHLAAAAAGPDEAVAGLLDRVAHRIVQRGDAPGAVSALVRAAELSTTTAAKGRRLAEAAYIGAEAGGAVIAQRPYLSHRAVGARLYRVFPKLGVSSRAGLRDALSARPGLDRPPREATGTRAR